MAGHIESWAASLVKTAMAKTGIEEREIARRSGVPEGTVSRIVSGGLQPTLPLLTQVLLGAGLEPRIRLEPFDDHDKILDARAAADPQRHAAAKRHLDEILRPGPPEANG